MQAPSAERSLRTGSDPTGAGAAAPGRPSQPCIVQGPGSCPAPGARIRWHKVKHILAAAAFALLCALFAGCGIAFSDASEANDFFVSLRVTGEKRVGAPLTAAVAYETIYPDPAEIICELRRGSETIRAIGRAEAPAVPGLTPDDDGVPGNFSFDFTVDAPGTYKVECYTAKEVANYIIEEFNVK